MRRIIFQGWNICCGNLPKEVPQLDGLSWRSLRSLVPLQPQTPHHGNPSVWGRGHYERREWRWEAGRRAEEKQEDREGRKGGKEEALASNQHLPWTQGRQALKVKVNPRYRENVVLQQDGCWGGRAKSSYGMWRKTCDLPESGAEETCVSLLQLTTWSATSLKN